MSVRFWITVLLPLVGFAIPASAQAQQPKPNIVFILMDDMRWDCMSCAGHPFIKTPNLDRLANEGAMFSNFFVSIPLCSPSRSSFLTGRYAHATGVIDNNDHSALSHELITWPRLLHDQGSYETAFLGKWHMGNDDTPRPGFDTWISFKGQGVYLNSNFNINGERQKTPGYITDQLTDYAVDFIRKKRDKPFALYLGEKAVHQPERPAERHKDLYKDDVLPRRPDVNDDLSGKPMLTRKLATTSPAGHPDHGLSDKEIRDQIRCIQAVDDGVGRILDALKETGQLDNTIIVFSSDNGYFWGEHQMGDKRAAYEESIRDPLLVRYPKFIKPGTKLDQLVLNIDLAPTFLELGGVAIPENTHGRSLVPLLRGDASAPWRSDFLTEYFHEPRFPLVPTWQAVRSDGWKYIHYTDMPQFDELYDLQKDPYEMKNVIGDPQAAEALKGLKARLEQLREETK